MRVRFAPVLRPNLGLAPAMLLVAIASAGCTKGGGTLTSSNIRIDGAGDEDTTVESSGTRMCVDPSNNVYVVWVDDRDGTQAVWMNRSSDGGQSWDADAIRVNKGDGSAFLPDVACTNDGVYVVWQDNRDGQVENGNIYYQRSFDGGDTWLDADMLVEDDIDGDTNSRAPRVAALGKKVWVTWFDSFRGSYDIFVATSLNGDSFEPQLRLDITDDAGASYSAWPQILHDGQNSVYVVWEDSRDGLSDVYFAGSYDGGVTFEPDVRLDVGDQPGQFNSYSPRFAARGSRIYVVWSDERNGDFRDILMNWSPNRGLTWSPTAIRVESDALGFYNSRFPDVALDDAGAAYIAWEDARSGGYDIYFRRSVDGNFAEEEQRLDRDTAGEGNSLNPRVRVQDQTVVVSWEDRRADDEGLGYNDIYYNHSLDGGVVWNDDLRIDSIAAGASYKVDINLALRDGMILNAWTDGRRGNQDVFFNRLAVGEEAEYVPVKDAP